MSRIPSSVFSRAKSGYRSRYSSNLVRRGILGSLAAATSRTGLQDAIDARGSAADHLGLLPDLHGVRHHQQRVQQLEQPLGLGGHVVQREPIAMGDRLFRTREEGAVEGL